MRTIAFYTLLIICGCAHHPGPAPGKKSVSGVLRQDTTLSGRIEVSGDVLVPVGVTLTLEPGAELVFLPAANSRVEPRYLFPATELLVRGTLRVEGTAEKPVRFTSPLKIPKAWAGIILDHSFGDTIKNAIIEYAEFGIYAIGSSPLISGNRIAHTVYGVLVRKDAGPVIENNHISSSMYGIFLGPEARMRGEGNRYEGIERKSIFPDLSQPDKEKDR